jgi:hypothetical protein
MMHAYAHAMQCNYGAKHLRCYTAQVWLLLSWLVVVRNLGRIWFVLSTCHIVFLTAPNLWRAKRAPNFWRAKWRHEEVWLPNVQPWSKRWPKESQRAACLAWRPLVTNQMCPKYFQKTILEALTPIHYFLGPWSEPSSITRVPPGLRASCWSCPMAYLFCSSPVIIPSSTTWMSSNNFWWRRPRSNPSQLKSTRSINQSQNPEYIAGKVLSNKSSNGILQTLKSNAQPPTLITPS